jgi:protein-S-isoprenylcysteine O-methyltransferase
MAIEPAAICLGAAYLLSETTITIRRRAAKRFAAGDKGSLRVIWLAGFVAIFCAYRVAAFPGVAAIPILQNAPQIGIGVFCLGTALRWYAIAHLGRLFTVNVAIVEDHRLIETGPYKWVRHPSYTGWLLAVTGLGLCLANWISLLILLAVTIGLIIWRVGIEEDALRIALGEAYASYASRTWRLIPYVC